MLPTDHSLIATADVEDIAFLSRSLGVRTSTPQPANPMSDIFHFNHITFDYDQYFDPSYDCGTTSWSHFITNVTALLASPFNAFDSTWFVDK